MRVTRSRAATSWTSHERINRIDPLEVFTGFDGQIVDSGDLVASVKVAEALRKLLFLSGKGLPATYTPVVLRGGTGPVTAAGAILVSLYVARLATRALRRDMLPPPTERRSP